MRNPPHINCLSCLSHPHDRARLFTSLTLATPRGQNTDIDMPSSSVILAPIATRKIKTGIVILTAPVALPPLVVSVLRRIGWTQRGAGRCPRRLNARPTALAPTLMVRVFSSSSSEEVPGRLCSSRLVAYLPPSE